MFPPPTITPRPTEEPPCLESTPPGYAWKSICRRYASCPASRRSAIAEGSGKGAGLCVIVRPVADSRSLPSRPRTRTLGAGHRRITASSGHRPLCPDGPRRALDSALETCTVASCTREQNDRLTCPTAVQRRGHRYLRRASRGHKSLDYRDRNPLNYRARSHHSSSASGHRSCALSRVSYTSHLSHGGGRRREAPLIARTSTSVKST